MIRFRGVYPCYDDTIILTSLQIPILPEIGYTAQKIPQRPGVLGVDKTHNARTITAKFELNGKSAAKNAALAASLALWAESETAGQLIPDETPDRFYLALLSEASEPDYAQAFPEVELIFTCANPYAFSVAQQQENVGETIVYGGSVAAWPTIEFTPQADIDSAQWTDGTRILRIEDVSGAYKLQAGHTFVIDCANRRITDNDDTSVMEHLTLLSDWLFIKRGVNNITGAGGIVKWRNIYL